MKPSKVPQQETTVRVYAVCVCVCGGGAFWKSDIILLWNQAKYLNFRSPELTMPRELRSLHYESHHTVVQPHSFQE